MFGLKRQIYFLFFLFVLTVAEEAKGQSAKNKVVSPIVVHEKERQLIIIPFENDTGDKNFDSLLSGLAKILTGKLQNYGFIAVKSRHPHFWLREKQDRIRHKKREITLRYPSVRLRVKRVKMNSVNFSAIKIYTNMKLARYFKADYLLLGRLIKNKHEPKRVILEITIYNALDSRTKIIRYSLDPNDAFNRLVKPAEYIFKAISIRSTAKININTKKPGGMAYLNDIYLGRTPLEYNMVPGKYILIVQQDGYHPYSETVFIRPNRRNVFFVKNHNRRDSAGLNVTSSPAGAAVYIDSKYLGKTPLSHKGLPPGTHRIRLSLDKHIDVLKGVTLRNGQMTRIKMELEVGDTESYIKDKRFVILDWTYYDFFFYSLISTLGFYGGYINYSMEADREAEKLLDQVPVMVSINKIDVLPALWRAMTHYQFYLLSQSETRVLRLKKRARNSAAAGAISLFMSAIFLYLDLTGVARVGEQTLHLEGFRKKTKIFVNFPFYLEGNINEKYGSGDTDWGYQATDRVQIGIQFSF